MKHLFSRCPVCGELYRSVEILVQGRAKFIHPNGNFCVAAKPFRKAALLRGETDFFYAESKFTGSSQRITA